MAKVTITVTMALALITLSGRLTSAEAQTAPKVAVSVEAAFNGAGPWSHNEDMLRAAGMADENPFGGGFFGTAAVAAPTSDRGAAWGFDVRMRVRPRFSVGLNVARSNNGSTYGYDAPLYFSGGIGFTGIHSMQTIAPMLTWHPASRVRLGVGPALHQMKYESPEAGLSLRENSLGMLAQAAFMFWDGKWFFSEITGQYRGVGALSVPSVTLTEVPYSSGDPLQTVVLPARDVPFQNWSVGVSLGMRLR
jgi:hypothetical protein